MQPDVPACGTGFGMRHVRSRSSFDRATLGVRLMVTGACCEPSRLRRADAWLRAALPGTALPSDPTGLTGVTYLWLGLSLLFAAFCGIGGLRHAFAQPYVVQDDARTFVFWMERFRDPGL